MQIDHFQSSPVKHSADSAHFPQPVTVFSQPLMTPMHSGKSGLPY
jgi:hypothetical protein